MKRVVFRDRTPIPPFGEPARDLRILNKPLWLLQRDLLARHCKGTIEIDSLDDVPANTDEELLIVKDNLFFNNRLIDTFIEEARASKRSCQIAFAKNDKMIRAHALRLQEGVRERDDVYVADIYYFPEGPRTEPQPLMVETQSREMGYYHIPRYMAPQQGDLVFQVPLRAFLSIENWVHVFLANTPLGVFGWARDAEDVMDRSSIKRIRHWTLDDLRAFGAKLSFVLNSFWERINPFEEHWRNHFLASKKMVKVGKNCSIDPTAIIHGPTVIGDNVYIGPGTVITNSLIGNNVNIMQGSQVMLSVISDRCFLPFNAAVFMSSMMENSMIAQNTTLQLGVVGRNSFIGANNVFTDFHLCGEFGDEIETFHKGRLEKVGLSVLGSAVGHNCKIGSGFVVYPGRMVGSNTTLIFSHEDNLIRRNVPGLSPDEIDEETGEARRIIYRWPQVYDRDGRISQLLSDALSDDADDADDDPELPQTFQMKNHASNHVLR
jgi:carbonic anhydrase/acetyltransferase-like protein (isoleucine patch superfamily)